MQWSQHCSLYKSDELVSHNLDMLLKFLTHTQPTTFHKTDSWGLYNQVVKGCNTSHGITALESFERHKFLLFVWH